MNKKVLVLAGLLVLLVGNVLAQMDTKIAAMTDNRVSAEEAAKIALNVGAQMPSFTLNDASGKPVSSDDLLKQGNLVLVFYRGAWCPYCNTYLRKLQKNLKAIEAAGGKLVAVSVENPDKSMTVVGKNELEFTVLSDPKLELARKFGIVYQLSPETDEKYKGYGIDLVNQNGTETPDLPLSATYIVKQNGVIGYAFLEPDYKVRAEPAEIIENLARLKQDLK